MSVTEAEIEAAAILICPNFDNPFCCERACEKCRSLTRYVLEAAARVRANANQTRCERAEADLATARELISDLSGQVDSWSRTDDMLQRAWDFLERTAGADT